MSFPKRLLTYNGVLAAPNAVLTREEAQNLIERTIKFSKADAIRVNLASARESNVRFAANQMSTAGLSSQTTIRVQSVFGKRKASVVTNNRTDEGLRRAVEQSEALAKLAPEDPEYLGELGPQQYTPIAAWFEGVTGPRQDRVTASEAQASSGATELVRLFAGIKDKRTRRRVIELVRAVRDEAP